ncbi:hypothetical protein [Bacterioplanoides sp.]|uniref:hypothetical protein n=1 Tax=Bacterioplanoides sp. TaxID=2066072 RepID=UPI003B00048C
MSWWQHPQAEQVISYYQALSQREKWLTLATLNILLVFLFVLFLIEPSYQRGRLMQSEAEEHHGLNLKLEQQLQTLQSSPILDPNRDLRNDIEALLREHQEIENRIGRLTDALVSPEDMVTVLEQMLTQDKSLKLTSLATLPREQVTLENSEQGTYLYRHSIEIRMNATYSSVLAYLQRLDALPWRLYWQRLDYDVTEYPRGDLVLQVYTLSSREDLVGG